MSLSPSGVCLGDIAAVGPQDDSRSEDTGPAGLSPMPGSLRGQIRAVFLASLTWKRWLIFVNKRRAAKVLRVVLRGATERSLRCAFHQCAVEEEASSAAVASPQRKALPAWHPVPRDAVAAERRATSAPRLGSGPHLDSSEKKTTAGSRQSLVASLGKRAVIAPSRIPLPPNHRFSGGATSASSSSGPVRAVHPSPTVPSSSSAGSNSAQKPPVIERREMSGTSAAQQSDTADRARLMVRNFKPAARLLLMMLRPPTMRSCSSAFGAWRAAAARAEEAQRQGARRKALEKSHGQEIEKAQEALKEAKALASLQSGLRDVEAQHRSNADRKLYLQQLAIRLVQILLSRHLTTVAHGFGKLKLHAAVAQNNECMREMQENLLVEASKRKLLASDVMRLTEADAHVSTEFRKAIQTAELKAKKTASLSMLSARAWLRQTRASQSAFQHWRDQSKRLTRPQPSSSRGDALALHLSLAQTYRQQLRWALHKLAVASVAPTEQPAASCEETLSTELVSSKTPAPVADHEDDDNDKTIDMAERRNGKEEAIVDASATTEEELDDNHPPHAVLPQTSKAAEELRLAPLPEASVLSQRAEKLLRLKVKLGLNQDFLENIWQVPRPLVRSGGHADKLDVLHTRLAKGSALLLGYVLSAAFQARLRIGINAFLAACLEGELEQQGSQP